MGDQSGALVAMDVANGDMLAFVSMPAFDPNSFSDGIGRTEWRMLSKDDHIPLLNKVAQGLYPSGSTIKPAMALAFLKQGIDPQAAGRLPGRLCGSETATSDATRSMARWTCVLRSSEAAIPISGRRALSPIPEKRPRWSSILATARNSICPFRPSATARCRTRNGSKKKYHREWQGYDSANTSIGQGYVLINPMQLAVMPARLASGKLLQPRLLRGAAAQADPRPRRRSGASRNRPRRDDRGRQRAWHRGRVEASARRHPDGRQDRDRAGLPDGLTRPRQSNWALRDHALFIAFAPADKPRYAIGCIIEHGGFGASAAAPIVRDSMTYLFDQQKAMDALAPLEKQWGGTLAERNARQAAAIRSHAASRASGRTSHDHVGDHSAAAGAAAVALDLPGRRNRRFRAHHPLFRGRRVDASRGRSSRARSFSSSWRSRSPCHGSGKRPSRRSPFPLYGVTWSCCSGSRRWGSSPRARSAGSTSARSASSRRNS